MLVKHDVKHCRARSKGSKYHISVPAFVTCAVQMYLYVGKWKFKVMERKEVERQAVSLRMTALDGSNKAHQQSSQNGASPHDADTLHDLENGVPASGISFAVCQICGITCCSTEAPSRVKTEVNVTP